MDTALIVAIVIGVVVFVGPRLFVKKKKVAVRITTGTPGSPGTPRSPVNPNYQTMKSILIACNVLGVILLIASRILGRGEGADNIVIGLIFLYGLIVAGMSTVAARIPDYIFMGVLCCVSIFGWIYFVWKVHTGF